MKNDHDVASPHTPLGSKGKGEGVPGMVPAALANAIEDELRVKPCGHRLPLVHRVVAKPILGGLHHEYELQRLAA